MKEIICLLFRLVVSFIAAFIVFYRCWSFINETTSDDLTVMLTVIIGLLLSIIVFWLVNETLKS